MIESLTSLTPPSEPIAHNRLDRVTHVGVDLMSMSRLSRALTRSPHLFRRLCTDQERADLCTPDRAGVVWATLLWTSKEAAAKCLETGFWRSGVDWPDLEIQVTAVGSRAGSTVFKPSQHMLPQLLDQASSERGVEVAVRPHHSAADVLIDDQLSGHFVIKNEMGMCIMHRTRGQMVSRPNIEL